MHFEVLAEDQSGKVAIEILLDKIIGSCSHTFTVHAYKGIGRIPRNLKSSDNAHHRILLQELPRLLNGYGTTFSAYAEDFPAVLIVVFDLDDFPTTPKEALIHVVQTA